MLEAQIVQHLCIGGESGIRTHGRFDPSPVFKTGALNRSAISPKLAAAAPCGAAAHSRTRLDDAGADADYRWMAFRSESEHGRPLISLHCRRADSISAGALSARKSMNTRTAGNRQRLEATPARKVPCGKVQRA